MDTNDTDVTPEAEICGICLGPQECPMLTTKCGHKLHQKCLKTWYSTSALSCPVCRTVPDLFNIDLVSCSRCRLEYLSGEAVQELDSSICLTRKCGHFHDRRCQTRHLQELPEEYPHTPAVYDRLILSEQPGCFSCKERLWEGNEIESDLTSILAESMEREQITHHQIR